MSLVREIIANHALLTQVDEGQIVTVSVDRIYIQDGNSPTIRRLFNENGFDKVFDPRLISVFFDHSVLSPTIEISDRLKEALDFCNKFGFDVFNHAEGISHVVALEQGWFKPGNLVAATDSHTCTGGVVQSLALGMGASDIAAAMVTGKTWLKVPETIWIKTVGKPSTVTSAKDVMLYVLSQFGDKRFIYKSIEWCGDWIESLSIDQASTIANMGVEMGAKCVFLTPWRNAPAAMKKIIPVTDNTIELNIENLEPFVACPHSPFNVKELKHCAGEKIDYVFVGSCANSRLDDISEISKVLKGKSISKTTRLIVTPGSRRVYLNAMEAGYIHTIVQSGGIVTPPGCGSCVGTQGYIPASGDKVLSTMNRNFLGRMGNPNSLIWLSSPKVAAYTAIKGEIPTVQDLFE